MKRENKEAILYIYSRPKDIESTVPKFCFIHNTPPLSLLRWSFYSEFYQVDCTLEQLMSSNVLACQNLSTKVNFHIGEREVKTFLYFIRNVAVKDPTMNTALQKYNSKSRQLKRRLPSCRRPHW